jgi:hypothetical protein
MICYPRFTKIPKELRCERVAKVDCQYLTTKLNQDERSDGSICLMTSLPFGRSSVPVFTPPQGEVQT